MLESIINSLSWLKIEQSTKEVFGTLTELMLESTGN